MFTGLVQTMGRVGRVETNAFGVRLMIDPAGWEYSPAPGESICVNGVCLTHTPPDREDQADWFAFDVILETLDKTNLGSLHEGDPVNLEPSLTPTTPMGGHFVQGHVDGIGRVVEVVAGEEQRRLTYETTPAVMRYVIPKGSIALDGVSMTIASVEAASNRFSVALIPTTIRETTLGRMRVGDESNLETDMIARAVVHQLEMMGGGEGEAVTIQTLRRAGFVG